MRIYIKADIKRYIVYSCTPTHTNNPTYTPTHTERRNVTFDMK